MPLRYYLPGYRGDPVGGDDSATGGEQCLTTMGAFALSALKVAGALVLVVLLGRCTRPALRFVARSGLREVFSAVALFLVFGFGLLLEEVGLSMAMGAFLAGVLLASWNTVMRWKAISNRLKVCCWGCFSSVLACR